MLGVNQQPTSNDTNGYIMVQHGHLYGHLLIYKMTSYIGFSVKNLTYTMDLLFLSQMD